MRMLMFCDFISSASQQDDLEFLKKEVAWELEHKFDMEISPDAVPIQLDPACVFDNAQDIGHRDSPVFAPPYGAFDVLFFDYGAAALMGASGLAKSYVREILKCAEECPSRTFLIVSRVQDYYVDDLLREVGMGEMPPNVMFDREDCLAFAANLLREDANEELTKAKEVRS